MKLDRNINKDGRGKYALILLRNTSLSLDEINQACVEACIPVDFGLGGQDFFVIRLKDKYAMRALLEYSRAAMADDPEYAKEIEQLALMSLAMAPKRPD